MKRKVYVEYEGKCPTCGRFQSSKRPDNVDIDCLRCEASKGRIRYVRDIKGYGEDDNTIEIAIETEEHVIIVKDYNPEINIIYKKNGVLVV